MLRRVGGKWEFYPHQVRYKKDGDERVQWALPSQDWWLAVAEKHGNVEIVEFEELEITQEMKSRLEALNEARVGESHLSSAIAFVQDGKLPEDPNHPLWWTKVARDIETVKPIELAVDKAEIKADGKDVAMITGEVPDDVEAVYVIVNSPPPVYEVINDGEIEIEFTTEDEGYHVIEVTAGNRRGLAVVKGVKPSGED